MYSSKYWWKSLHCVCCQQKSFVELAINLRFFSSKIIDPNSCDSFNLLCRCWSRGATAHHKNNRTIIINTYMHHRIQWLVYAQKAFCNWNIKDLDGYNEVEKDLWKRAPQHTNNVYVVYMSRLFEMCQCCEAQKLGQKTS